MSAKTIFVTGGTGYLGSHVISQLLEKGYNVRATARSAAKLRTIFPDSPADRLEIVEVPSLTADHTKFLTGVDALIHCGSPTIFRGETLEEILDGAYHGAIDVAETAIKVGVKKIIATSTVGAMFQPDFSNGYGTVPIGPDAWGSVPFERIDLSSSSPGQAYVYLTAKTAAEKKLWELADQHEEIDLTTILPSMIWGPFVPNYEKVLSASPCSLGTVSSFKDLFDRTDYPQNVIGHVVDVRDVARAHVLALSAPPLPNKEHKRLISSHRNFTWKETVKFIREKYAGEEKVQKRLLEEEAAANAVKQVDVPLDDSLTRKAIGFGDYTPFEDTVIATFEAFSLWEKTFKN